MSAASKKRAESNMPVVAFMKTTSPELPAKPFGSQKTMDRRTVLSLAATQLFLYYRRKDFADRQRQWS
jgi:hypothetical protein